MRGPDVYLNNCSPFDENLRAVRLVEAVRGANLYSSYKPATEERVRDHGSSNSRCASPKGFALNLHSTKLGRRLGVIRARSMPKLTALDLLSKKPERPTHCHSDHVPLFE
jgi:hypothetical protein